MRDVQASLLDRLRIGAKTAYVALMRPLGRGLDRLGLMPRSKPKTRLGQWLVALTSIRDAEAMVQMDVPWWTYRAIDAVEAWLVSRPKPVRVFEYGSGASTAWLARRADEVHSVEHDRSFAEVMRPIVQALGDVDLIVVDPVPSAQPKVPSGREGHRGLDFGEYVDAIERVGGDFDLVVIDGRARDACLRAAVPHLKADGLIVFDNSRRSRYRDAIETSGLLERRLSGLTPTAPYPMRTSLLTKP